MAKTGYGANARIGIGPPQANPTVEPEIAALLPADVAMYVTRLTSQQPAAQDRLVEYLENLDGFLERYDTLALDAFGFACTGSTYLLGADAERRIASSISEARGFPVITCARAIVAALEYLGAKSLAIYSPYPDWLHEASEQFWRSEGFDIVATHTLNAAASDTRTIYAQNPEDVAALILEDDPGADVSLITGTGLPSLGIVRRVSEACERTVLSSNLCLAWRLLDEVGLWTPPEGASRYPLLTPNACWR